MEDVAVELIKRDSEAVKALATMLKNKFYAWEKLRGAKEQEWLEDIRQYKGLYDPDVKIEKNASKIYPKLTRSKVNMALSRLHEMLFPTSDRNWEIEPTPLPDIDTEIALQIAMSLVKQDPETGQPVMPTDEEVQVGITKYVKKCCQRMQIKIDDQLTEMDFPEVGKAVLRSGLKLGTGVAKGPVVKRNIQHIFKNNQMKAVDVDAPYLDFVRIWDWYPDMYVTSYEEAEGCFERHVMTKSALRDLAKRKDFWGDEISLFLRDNPDGNATTKTWELGLQAIEKEAGAKGAATSSGTLSGSGRRYEALEYWGVVDAASLNGLGLDIDDNPLLEYWMTVWVLGDTTIKAKIFKNVAYVKNYYKLFYFEKDETSIFGEGLPRPMRHSQIAVSSSARAVLDNASCVAGPMLEVFWSLFKDTTDCSSFHARKIWLREGRGLDMQYPGIRAIQLDSHITELLSIMDTFKRFADEETTLPTWLIGEMGNTNETASAASQRMSNVAVSIKDIVRNFDRFITDVIQSFYDWNMNFVEDSSIKGDFKIKARGSSSLVMKEIRMQTMNQLAATMTPEDWVYVPRREFLEERFKTHDIRITLREESEAEEIRQSMQDQEARKLAMEEKVADITYRKAQTAHTLTKAKDKNIEAIQKSEGVR